MSHQPQSPQIARAIRAQVLSFQDAPDIAQTQLNLRTTNFLDDALVLVTSEGSIAQVQPWDDESSPALVASAQCAFDDFQGHLLMPGFVDTHVHYAQLEVIASHGTQLLEWLETYTFPAERRFEDPEHARAMAALFIRQLQANGTTTAAVWPTVHADSVDAFFEAARAADMRMVCGKVMMDQHCPEFLQDTVSSAERDCSDLIQRWHGKGRLSYAVTPRFAITSSPKQMQLAGELFRATPGALMQTHVAENQAELAWVAELFPQARSYLDVYDAYGLLGPGAQFAHGIWLDEEDRARLAATGSALAFCPTSNLFLGSGLFDYAGANRNAIALGMATDVGGGTSLSMWQTLHEAYKVQALRGERISAYSLLYCATLGGARALQMGHKIGKIAAGYEADFVIWKWAVNELQALRMDRSVNLHDRLFALMMSANAQHLAALYVNGKPANPNGTVSSR
jgi:guanine deaminase